MADAPFGARLKALLLYMKLGGFRWNSVLTLARQIKLSAGPVAPASPMMIMVPAAMQQAGEGDGEIGETVGREGGPG